MYYITNDVKSDEDDFYVKWDGGAWVETYKPNIENLGLDRSTMPHQIYKTGNNAFTVDRRLNMRTEK